MGFLNAILSKCVFKGAEATCVEIGTEIKKKKNALDGKICSISVFPEIFSSHKHVLAGLFRK